MKHLFLFLIFLLILTNLASAKMMSVADPKVNLRSGPSVKKQILWEFGKGFPLQVVATKGNWYKVTDFENDSGWVYRKLLSKVPHMIVKKKRINIRSGPSSKYKLIGKANYGVVFKTLAQKKGWVEVKHENGLVGWVRRDLVWGW